MEKEELLAEFDDLFRTMPPRATIRHETDENLSWLGRALALLDMWDKSEAILAQIDVTNLHNINARVGSKAFMSFVVKLNHARQALMLQTRGPLNVVVPESRVFEYFDGIRKIIELAQKEILFVDPYLEAEFVANYLPLVKAGVDIRLLSSNKLDKLIPAVKKFAEQNEVKIEIRSAPNIHDRFIFVDGEACYQSGASFKDGARNAPSVISQIVDAFPAMLQTYENIWQSAEIEL